jgi:hypothetical protein
VAADRHTPRFTVDRHRKSTRDRDMLRDSRDGEFRDGPPSNLGKYVTADSYLGNGTRASY